MKSILKKILVSTSLLATITTFSQMTFVHPGGNNNKHDLDYVKAKIQASEQPWLAKFNQVKNLAIASTRTTAQKDENGQKTDARKLYANALVWYYTDDVKYAENAVKLFKVWATTFNGYATTDGQDLLQGAWIGALMAPAAEVLSQYSAWNAQDKADVQTMFKTKFYPVLNKMSTWNGNVDLTQIDAMMNMAVFCEDETEFNLGLSRLSKRNPAYFYLTTDLSSSRNYGGSSTSSWSYPNPGSATGSAVTSWVDGITQETCRDNNHHAQYAMASAIHAAEVAWNQGVDVYGDNQERYTSLLELMALQVNSGDMQGTCGDNVTSKSLYNTWEMAYNHYHNRKGMDMPNTLAVITNKIRTSGQSDWNIFYETLTHAEIEYNLNAINKKSDSTEVVVYPNPSSSGVFNLLEEKAWEVYSIEGTQLMNGEGSKIDLNTYSKGIYLLKIEGVMNKIILE